MIIAVEHNETTIEATIENGTITNADGSALTTDVMTGDEVSFKVTANEGYKVSEVKLNGIGISATEGVYSFTATSTNEIDVKIIEEGAKETVKYTISFSVKDVVRTEYDKSHQVWVQNGITVTNNKGASTSNVGDYDNPARFYKSSEVIISSETAFNTVVIDVSGMDAKYCTPYTETLSALGTVTIQNQIVTLVLNESTTSITFKTTAQVRANSITVYEE